MVWLAGISALRDWVTIGKDDERVRVDVLEQLWYLEKSRLSFRAASDVVEEAIVVYYADQTRSRIRTYQSVFLGGSADRLAGWRRVQYCYPFWRRP